MRDIWVDLDDRRLLDLIREVVNGEEEMPDCVADAAKALHDWVRLDATLADLAPDAVLTRSADLALDFVGGTMRIRVEVEPAGYRRRLLTIVALDEGTAAAADDVTLQLGNGTSVTVAADAFGERTTRVPAGSIRVVALSESGAVVTPWFTV